MNRSAPHRPGVLVIRPAGQATATARALHDIGCQPVLFPTVEIIATELHSDATAQQQLRQLDTVNWLVFVSRNAVEHFLPFWQSWHKAGQPGPQVAAVGKATAQALEQAAIPVNLLPADDYTSEGLLNSNAWQQVAGQRFLIIRGVGGRELMAQTLRERGADVRYLEVYQRILPEVDSQALIERWSEDIDVILATSNQLLDNLLQLIGKPLGSALLDVPVVVISERMQQHARQLGFGKIWLAGGASNDQMVEAIKTHLPLN